MELGGLTEVATLPAKEGYTDLILVQISPSHTRTSQEVAHMIHRAVHDVDNISFQRARAMRIMITEGYSTSPYRASSQLICNTLTFNTTEQGKPNE
jgi:hypothetical protein